MMRQRYHKTGTLTGNTLTLNPYPSIHCLGKLTTEVETKSSAALNSVNRFFQAHKLGKEVSLIFETYASAPITYRYQDKLVRTWLDTLTICCRYTFVYLGIIDTRSTQRDIRRRRRIF